MPQLPRVFIEYICIKKMKIIKEDKAEYIQSLIDAREQESLVLIVILW